MNLESTGFSVQLLRGHLAAAAAASFQTEAAICYWCSSIDRTPASSASGMVLAASRSTGHHPEPAPSQRQHVSVVDSLQRLVGAADPVLPGPLCLVRVAPFRVLPSRDLEAVAYCECLCVEQRGLRQKCICCRFISESITREAEVGNKRSEAKKAITVHIASL